jgi:subtilisin family serine protease
MALVAGVMFATVPWPAFGSVDTYSARQWNMRHVDAEKAWAVGRGEGVTIAIVDTGVDLEHPDLKGAFVDGFDFVDNDSRPDDENGHGTHVAGIAAARSNNYVGVAGVAPQAKIMPIRVLDDDGRGSASDVEAGVKWAVDRGADVVNLSLSGSVVVEGLTRGTLNAMVDYAWSKGAVPVIAAGNGGLFRTDSSDARRILVTATTDRDTLADYATSVGFADWGMAAPGGDTADGEASMIYSTLWDPVKGSGYGYGIGTSMAAPHVSGAAAILRGLGLDAPKTVERILATAQDIGSSGDDFTYGSGLLDVAAAVKGLGPKAVAEPTEAPRRPAGRPRGSIATDDVLEAAPTAAPRSTTSAAGAKPTSKPTASPRARMLASDEMSEKSALANIVIASTLLAAAAGLVGYGGFRRVRSGGG